MTKVCGDKNDKIKHIIQLINTNKKLILSPLHLNLIKNVDCFPRCIVLTESMYFLLKEELAY